MINYIEKGLYLHKFIAESKYKLWEEDGVFKSDNDIEVQKIIDSFDPLPAAKIKAFDLIKEASAKQRLNYVTQAAGKDAEYTFKATEAAQYSINQSVGVFMQARANATGESPATIAAEWNYRSMAWQSIGAAIAAIEDKSAQDINAEKSWQNCDIIAQAAIKQLEAI